MPCPVCTFWKLPGLAHGPLISGIFPNLVVEALGNLSLTLGGGHLFQEGKSYEIPSEKRKRELWPRFQSSKPIWELGDPQVSIHYPLPHTSQMQVSRNARLRFQTPSPNATYCLTPNWEAPRTFLNTVISSSKESVLCCKWRMTDYHILQIRASSGRQRSSRERAVGDFWILFFLPHFLWRRHHSPSYLIS